MKSRRVVALLATAAVGAGLLAGCSSDHSPGSSNGKVYLTVAPVLPGATADALKALSTRVKQFEKANPNIIVKAIEWQWTGTTFAAELAGGTLPDVFNVPFTDSKALANNGQLADITKYFDKTSTAKKWNKNVLDVATGDNGHVYGIPWGPYAMALSYNRKIFTEAGLNPNDPPTTLDQIEQDAKIISQKVPGVAGYMQMTTGNNGGWELAADTYGLGGRLETESGGKWTVDTDNPQTKQALQWLQKLRWTDDSMGSNFLYDWSGINQAFASGKIGMYMSGSDVIGSLMQANGFNQQNYGVTVFPVDSSNANAGILSGGNVDVVNVKDSPAQIAAAVKWIDFYRTLPTVNKAAAVSNAKTLIAGKQAVGAPTLPVFDKATWEQNQKWIAPYVNVPPANVKPFTDGIFSQKIVPEPEDDTQNLYGALDSVVQAVLTKRNVDVDSLLKGVDTKIQAQIDAGQ